MGSSNTGARDDPNTDLADQKPPGNHSDSGVFTEGEKVLAYHGPCIYEAKVQRVDLAKKEPKYYVHYLGWNKNWDEWVGADRLLKCTEENLEKQQVLSKKQGADKNPKSGRSTQSKPKSSTEARADKEDPRNVGRSKKRKLESGMEEKDTVSADKHVKIQIPATLKKQLIDDCDFVTQMGKLVKLPRTPTIDDILKKYLDYKSKKDAVAAESIGEILKGLQSYFNKVLPLLLLYKQEQQQFHAQISVNSSPSAVYGAEHLLRLFVKLPTLLASANIDEEALIQLLPIIHDFLKYLQKNQNVFFLSTYNGPQGVEANLSEEDD